MARMALTPLVAAAPVVVLLALLMVPLWSSALQWDRPLSLPPALSWHTAVPMDIGAVQIRSNRDNRIRPQAWANFTLQGHLIVGESNGQARRAKSRRCAALRRTASR